MPFPGKRRRVGAALARWLTAVGLAVGLAATLAAAETQKGRLRILQNGQPIGSEQYEIAGTGTEIQARSTVTLTAGGQGVRQSSSLLLTAGLAPRSYEWKMEEPEGKWCRVAFAEGQATIRFLRPDGKEEVQVFDFKTERVAVLDINFFHHYLFLVRLYDFAQGGPQSIQVFIPQSVQPGVVTVELRGVTPQTVEGRAQPVRQLSITTVDNQLNLWVTESGRFVRLQVPGANVEVVPESAAP